MDKYIKFTSESELHTELTNILLLCTEDSSDCYYFYCERVQEKNSKSQCDLCSLIEFLYDIEDKNLMNGLSPKKFLQLNYNNKSKLEEFANKILPFFKAIELNEPEALDFFKKKYTWSMKDYSNGETCSLSLEEVIESEKELVENNPCLFDADFLSKKR